MTPGVNPFALAALAAAASRYPANDLQAAGDGLNTGGFRFNTPVPVRDNATTLRLDANITKSQTLFGRYQFQFDNSIGVSRFPDTAAPNTWSHPQGLAAGHTWTINNNAVNRFTYGFTRDAFTRGGDSTQNAVSFRFIYSPENFTRSLTRITPVHNIVDDFTYVWGNHTISTGANVRLISNNRVSTASSFDNAVTNPSFYDESGDVVIISNGASIFPNVASSSAIDLRDALTAVIGRFSQYGADLQFARDGSLLPSGAGIGRTFKTEEYEFYAQDSWRVRKNLTFNYGLRYSTSTPVYEANGLQVKPTTSLNDFFNNRVAAANNGSTYNELLTVDLAGKANDREGFYKQDFNNFAPSISVAYSPSFKTGVLKTIFGGEGKSTIRGGFRMTYDRIGSALAVAFDLNSTLGFSSSAISPANSFNVTDRLGPLFTGFGQDIRNPLFFGGPSAAVGALPSSLTFPLRTPADDAPRIEQSLDDKLTTPYNYNFNLSYGREIFGGITVEASYVGRIAKDLLVSRDTTHFNNVRDPQTGEDFYGVMRRLINFRETNAPISSIPNIAWFNRFVPGLAGAYNVCGVTVNLTATQAAYRRVARPTVNGASGTQCIGGRNTTDYTFIQQGLWNFAPIASVDNLFVHPQYATFAAYTTAGDSDYHGAQLSVRKRFGNGFAFDFNYTYAHSLDTASGTEAAGSSPSAISSGASLILNPLDLNENRASSDFDVRHLINANFVYQLPFGRGKTFFGNSNKYVNALLGGFTLTGIYRWNTGFPIGQPFDDGRWATNWNVQSNGVALQRFDVDSDTTGDSPNLFSDPTAAYLNYRNAYPGEAGDRNILREPNYVSIDLGLQKNFKITETNKLQFRIEVFNVTNTQRFTGIESFGLRQDPYLAQIQAEAEGDTFTAPTDFGRFTRIQGEPRVVQFVVRYDF